MTEYEHLLAFTPFSDAEPPKIFLVKAAEADHPFTICVDLDGTLAESQTPFNPDTIGEPRAQAIEWVQRFSDAGARIIIFTVRGDKDLVGQWLDDSEVPYDYINENPDQPENASGKILADAYFDDRAYNAKDPDEFGPEILSQLRQHIADEAEDAEPEDEASPVAMVIRRVTIIAAPDLLRAFKPAL